MQIRFLTTGDEDLLIRAVAFIEDGAIDRAKASAHLADKSLVNVVALEGAEVVGFIHGYVLRRFDRTSFFIYSVDVAEPARRRGIAKAMLTALREHGQRAGWDEAFVFTNASNPAGMALYQSVGGVRPNPDDVMFDFDFNS
jgi:ribosomal protein S18 acetylase RimI-like enzyme